MAKWINKQQGEKINETQLSFLLIFVIASAMITELIGIHSLFGAFLIGAIIPQTSNIAKDLHENLLAYYFSRYLRKDDRDGICNASVALFMERFIYPWDADEHSRAS